MGVRVDTSFAAAPSHAAPASARWQMQQFRARRERIFRIHSGKLRLQSAGFHAGRKVAARWVGRTDAAGSPRVARDTGAARAET
jgi:hypothetical protein